MPLKFVTNQIDLEDGNITIQDGTTPTSKVIPTPTVLSDETGSANFVPESVTDGDGSATGFSLSFTDSATYDIDEILFNIRRDNPDSSLLMEVVSENSQYELLIQLSTQEILNEYFNQDFLTDNQEVIPNINLIPNFALLLETRYQQKLEDLEYIEDNELAEGSLAINSAQPKIGVKKDDMVKYLLSDRPAKRVTPLVNLNRPLAIWNDLTTDLNTPDDNGTFDTYFNNINDMDAGTFTEGDPIYDLDGGEFSSVYDPVDQQLDGGDF